MNKYGSNEYLHLIFENESKRIVNKGSGPMFQDTLMLKQF